MTPTLTQATENFLGQGILGTLCVVLAAVIVFLFLRSEKLRAELEKGWAAERKELQAKLDAEHRARLDDARQNQVVLLEVHDRVYEQTATLEKALDRLPPRR